MTDPWQGDDDHRNDRSRTVKVLLGVAWIIAAFLLALGTWFFFIRPPS